MIYKDEYKIAMADVAANQYGKHTVSSYGKELIEARDRIAKLEAALRLICETWRQPEPAWPGETPLETAINERDQLYSIASAALAGSPSTDGAPHG